MSLVLHRVCAAPRQVGLAPGHGEGVLILTRLVTPELLEQMACPDYVEKLAACLPERRVCLV